jgi:CHAT domain-containing protein/tetratricopeptide (TPR) repeat protein
MAILRSEATAIAELTPAESRARIIELGLLDAEGLDELLAVTRTVIRDDPAAGERLATTVRNLAIEAKAPAAAPRADYLLAQGRAAAGDMSAALGLIERAREGFAALGLTYDALRTNLGLTQALNEMARHDDALAACNEILEAYERSPGTDEALTELAAMAHQNSGLCMELMGRFEEALQHYGAAKFGYELLHDSRAVAEVTYDRAGVLLSLGQHAEALSALQRAVATFREGGFRSLLAMALANVAEVQLHRGEYQQCLDSLTEAATALEGISSPGGEQVRLLVAGRAYLALNLLPEALASFSDAVRLLAGTDLVIDRARANWGLGLALARSGESAAATRALEAAADQFRRSGQSSWLAEVLVDQARLLRASGSDTGAADIAEEANEVAVAGTPAAAVARLLLAELNSGGDLRALRRVVDDVTALRLTPLVASATHAYGRGLLAGGQIDAAHAALGRAVDAVESLRGNLAHELVLTRFLDDKLSPYEDLLHTSLLLGRPADESLDIAELAKSRTLSDVVSGLVARHVDRNAPDDDLRALYGELFAGEGAADPERATRLRERVRDLETEREMHQLRTLPIGTVAPEAATNDRSRPDTLRLDDGELAISYAVTGDSLHAFIVTNDAVHVATSIASVAEVISITSKLSRQWERFRLGSDVVERHLPQLLAAATTLLGQLHAALLAPLSHLIDGYSPRRLLIVPDMRLQEVPFQALWDGERWLVERYEIRYAPSLEALGHLAPHRAGPTVLAGVADELAPSILEELDRVRSIRPDALTFVGERARWHDVCEACATAGHLHLAGHAMFRPDNPMYSLLRLHDGWVAATDVLGLDMKGATVVLSACETARTSTAGTAEMNGFVRGFLGAGASTVIASQWTADDRATTEFMIELYTRLTDHDPSAAVREAQLVTAARWPHPYYWAPWIVVGRAD